MYYITIRNYAATNGEVVNLPISGIEAAWSAFRTACELGDMCLASVVLWDGETGKVIADNEEDAEE